MHKQPGRRGGFTLIELMVVIAIIGILVVLLFPAMNKARVAAKKAKAREEVAQIETAWRAYLNEYSTDKFRDVMGYGHPLDQMELANGIQMVPSVLRVLAGEGANGSDEQASNPMQQTFLEPPSETHSSDGKIANAWNDPWGNPYKFMLDFNGNGVVEVRVSNATAPTNLMNVTVAVWSCGPDKLDMDPAVAGPGQGNWNDDIRNW